MVSQGRMGSVMTKNEGTKRIMTQTTKCAARTSTSLEGVANCAECCWLEENIENCCVLEWTHCSVMVPISGSIHCSICWDKILRLEERCQKGVNQCTGFFTETVVTFLVVVRTVIFLTQYEALYNPPWTLEHCMGALKIIKA